MQALVGFSHSDGDAPYLWIRDRWVQLDGCPKEGGREGDNAVSHGGEQLAHRATLETGPRGGGW